MNLRHNGRDKKGRMDYVLFVLWCGVLCANWFQRHFRHAKPIFRLPQTINTAAPLAKAA
jgi:hypothetical protein